MLTGLIMAGGRGERMRRSWETTPKPLVEVGGVTLIERNVQQLIRARVERIVIAVAAGDAPLREVVASRLCPLGAAAGMPVEELVESVPRGNVGAAGALAHQGDVIVVFADNLTTIDLRGLHAEHRARAADLTLATHVEPFPVPFGQPFVDASGRLLAYVEKPALEILIGSGVAVLGERALRWLGLDRVAGISDVAQALVDEGARVFTCGHDRPWIDVNDASARERAEQLVAARAADFDRWLPEPVERWELALDPALLGAPGPAPAVAVVERTRAGWRRVAGGRGAVSTSAGASIDALELATGRRLRVVVTPGPEVPWDPGPVAAPDAPDASTTRAVVAVVRGRASAAPVDALAAPTVLS